MKTATADMDPALFETMAQMNVTIAISGYDLGALATVLDVAEESGRTILARDISDEQRKTTEGLQKAVLRLKEAVDSGLAYLTIVTSAQLAAHQDNAATAPSTTTPQ